NHAIDDADDQADDRQKAEQAGHLSALKHRINHGMIHHVRLGVARGSGKRVGGGSIGDKEPGQRKCGQSRPSNHLAEKMSDTASSAPSSASPETEIPSALGPRLIVLVGMMGAGKSTIGRRLASRLRLPFLDADSEIETAAGMTIP